MLALLCLAVAGCDGVLTVLVVVVFGEVSPKVLGVALADRLHVSHFGNDPLQSVHKSDRHKTFSAAGFG